MSGNPEKPAAVSVIIPALDEQDTVADVVRAAALSPLVNEVIVVDNGSSDDTAVAARAAGASVLVEPAAGQGNALRTGYAAARNDWIVKLDADLSAFSPILVETLQGAVSTGVGLVKGLWFDANDNMPMTRLMVSPAIAILFPGLSHIRAVNSGLFLFDRSRIAVGELTGGYGADLDVMLRMHTAGWETVEVEIGSIRHNTRSLEHYNKMSEALLRFLIDRYEQAPGNDLFIVANTAEDLIGCCFGLAAKKLKSGSRVTAFLGHERGYGAAILREALAGYPTFSIEPVCAVGDVDPLPPRRKTTIITHCFSPAIGAGAPVVGAALRLQGKLNRTGGHGTLLSMPVHEDGRPPNDFHADVRVDISPVARLKKQAREALGERSQAGRERTGERGMDRLVWNGSFNPQAVESFRAFDSRDMPPPFTIL